MIRYALGFALSVWLFPQLTAQAKESIMSLVRIAELEIDPVQVDAYVKAVSTEIDDAVCNEPGVLAIYCVTLKDQPSSFRLLEIYADQAAYEAHIAGPYFKHYAKATQGMIVSKRLIETVPVQLKAKPPGF